VGHDNGRPLRLNNDVGNGEGFAGSGGPEQNLVFHVTVQAINQTLNCFWLIA
jgi:hypothetical protein